MAKFQALKYKRDLKNAQHFAFVQAFITAMQAAGFTAAKIVAKLAELVAAFGTEDRYYMQIRASEIIAQKEAADLKRDRYYTRLHRLVQAWAGSGMAQLDEAATALIGPCNLYKVRVNAQMDEETGVLENLITDLQTPQMQAHLTTINGTWLFQQMVDGQTLVKSLRMEQGVEQSEKVYGALASARKQCDALYDELTALIEAFAVTADDAVAYDTFITQWNGSVKLYQDMLDRKSGTPISNTGGGVNSGNQNDNGGGSDSGSGSTSGSGSSSGGVGTITTGGGSSSGSDSGSGSGSSDNGGGSTSGSGSNDGGYNFG